MGSKGGRPTEVQDNGRWMVAMAVMLTKIG